MKKFIAVLLALLTLVACNKKEEATGPKVLVLYYSQSGTTKTVAEEIKNQLGADIEQIVPVEEYTGDFEQISERYNKDKYKGVLPLIKDIKSDVNAYDVVFLGYPIWFGEPASPVLSLVENMDLSGVKLVPFCTYGGDEKVDGVAGLEMKSCAKLNYDSTFSIKNDKVKNISAEIESFLKECTFLTPSEEQK